MEEGGALEYGNNGQCEIIAICTCILQMKRGGGGYPIVLINLRYFILTLKC